MICHYTPLEAEALLHITGPDTIAFLQGQTTCDTSCVDPGHAIPGAYCTPQGRVVCDFLLCQLAEGHYGLRMRRDILSGSAATFGKYIIFSKAELDAGRNDWQVLACWGPDAAQALHTVFGKTPAERYGARAGEGFVLVQMDEHGQQFECYLKEQSSPEWQAQMDETMLRCSASEWEAAQIRSGIGRIEAPTVEQFIPQMLNYDLTGHVNFSKGCYTGQEVVARMHYRGKSKRRMYLAQLPGDTPAAGTALYSSGSEQSVGNIVNSATADNRTLALVVATADGVANGLHLAAQDGPALEVGELPYSLESD